MPADKGGLWVEDKLISGFNPVKTDTLFSLSPPRWSSWIGRVVPSPSLLRTAGSLSSQRPGADATTYTDLRIWHFILREKHFGHEDVFAWSHVTCPTFSYFPSGSRFGSQLRLYMRPLSAKNKSWEREMKQFQTVSYCLFSDICWDKFMQSKSTFLKQHLLIDIGILPDHTEVRPIDK